MCMGSVLLILPTAFDTFASSAGILFPCLWAMDSWIVLEYFLPCLHCAQFCPVCFLCRRFVPFFYIDQMLVHPGEYGFVCCSYLTWALLMYARWTLFKKVMMKCLTKGFDKIHLLILRFHFFKRSNFCKYSSLTVFEVPQFSALNFEISVVWFVLLLGQNVQLAKDNDQHLYSIFARSFVLLESNLGTDHTRTYHFIISKRKFLRPCDRLYFTCWKSLSSL